MENEVKNLFKIGTASSGNYGHAGVPGHWGGSAPGGGHTKMTGMKRQQVHEALKRRGERALREHLKRLINLDRLSREEKGTAHKEAQKQIGATVAALTALHREKHPTGKWAKEKPKSRQFWARMAHVHQGGKTGHEKEFMGEASKRGVRK